jgi:hypothetical protein
MAGLNRQDLDILRHYSDQQNRELYWNYLAHKEGNDGYGLLALGVVRNDNAPGATANTFADMQAHRDGVRLTERQWNSFGTELMQRDFAARDAHFKDHRPDLALNLPVKDVQEAHDLTFKSHHINPDGWTPRQLLEAARRHGGEPAAEQVWSNMLNNASLGLDRLGNTTLDIRKYDDEKLNATSYLGNMAVARAAAGSERPNTDPGTIGNLNASANYDARSQSWWEQSSGGGYTSIPRQIKDPARIEQLNDTRQLRLERESLRHDFHPQDPYRNQPVMKSPFLLSENAPDTTQPAQTLASAAAPDQPGHPRHNLHQQCSAGVEALDRQLGRQADQSSACMSASLTRLAAANGFDRVDHVLLSVQGERANAGQNVFIVQGEPRDPAHRRAHMPTDEAVSTPVEASFRQLAQADQQHANVQAQQANLQQEETVRHAGPAMG